jgi:hypothetical protein
MAPVARGGDEVVRVGNRRRALVDGDGRRDVAAPQARDLLDLDLDVVAVSRLDLGNPLVGAAQPARQVVTDVQVDLRRRLRAEVRIERDQPLDLVERPVGLA